MLLEESLLDGADDDFADLFPSASTVTVATAKSTLFDGRLDATVSAFVDRDPALLGGPVASDAETDALVKQLSEEAELENKYGGLRKKMDEDLEERYKRLKEGGIPGGKGTDQAGKVTGSRQKGEVPRLGPPPKAVGREEFKSEEDEIENWCCKYRECVRTAFGFFWTRGAPKTTTTCHSLRQFILSSSLPIKPSVMKMPPWSAMAATTTDTVPRVSARCTRVLMLTMTLKGTGGIDLTYGGLYRTMVEIALL